MYKITLVGPGDIVNDILPHLPQILDQLGHDGVGLHPTAVPEYVKYIIYLNGCP